MKNVIIITTRNYPCDDNPLYRDLEKDGEVVYAEELLSNAFGRQLNSDEIYKSLWNQSNASWTSSQLDNNHYVLSIKYRQIDNIHLYIAPCQSNENGNQPIPRYLTEIIKAVRSTHADDEYNLMVFCHDRDFSRSEEFCITLLDNNTPDCANSTSTLQQYQQIFPKLKLICGFQHNSGTKHNAVLNIINATNSEEINNILITFDKRLMVKNIGVDDATGVGEKKNEMFRDIKPQISNGETKNGTKYLCFDWTKSDFKKLMDLSIDEWDKLNNLIETDSGKAIGTNSGEVIHVGDVPIIHILSNELKELQSRSKYFFDSSIIHYVISKKNWNSTKQEDKQDILSEIDKNKNRYDLLVCAEVEKLNQDLLRIRLQGGHGKNNVVPFIFHSEQKRKQDLVDFMEIEQASSRTIEEILEDLNEQKDKKKMDQNSSDAWTDKDQADLEKLQEVLKHKKLLNDLRGYKWRFLLVDDHAVQPMRKKKSNDDDNNNSSKLNKLSIIVDNIQRIFKGNNEINIACMNGDKNMNGDDILYKIPTKLTDGEPELEEYTESPDITIYYATTEEGAKKALQQYKFEVILLDYLLGDKNNDNNKSREYGYNILKAIDKDWKESKCYKYGPHKRMFFMFISAFTTAVNDRLLAEGLHRSTEYWHIGDGACPTNTPYLFMHNLVHLMEKRLKDTGIRKLGLDSIQELTSEIFDPKQNIRQRANKKFDDVLSLLYHYKRLMKDIENYTIDKVFSSGGSVLATSFINGKPSLGGLLEHLTQLVYLTAFGTIRQWPEMWSEYMYIQSIYDAEYEKADNKTKTAVHDSLKLIEDYILNLKTGAL